jgi:hypothetical protein
MRNTCVKAVHGVGSGLVKASNLVADVRNGVWEGVYSTRLYAQPGAQVLRATVHKMCSIFTPVIVRFMPSFHSPYNKLLRTI